VTGVRHYLELLRGPARIGAMREAIRAAVQPGDRVLEIGTGLGTWALVAAEAGAELVVALDREPIVHVAESAALVRPRGTRVRFLRADFPGVLEADHPDSALFESPFDVVVFEDYPGLLVSPATTALLRRVGGVLAPGGRLIPGRARIRVAPVEDPALARKLVPDPSLLAGTPLDADLLRGFVAHEPLRTQVDPAYHLCEPLDSGAVDLLPPPTASALRVHGTFTVARSATVHALVAWFDLESAPGEWISNGPGGETQPWGQFALPVYPPLEIAPGVEVRLAAGPVGGPADEPGAWGWEVACGRESRRGDESASTPLGRPDLAL